MAQPRAQSSILARDARLRVKEVRQAPQQLCRRRENGHGICARGGGLLAAGTEKGARERRELAMLRHQLPPDASIVRACAAAAHGLVATARRPRCRLQSGIERGIGSIGRYQSGLGAGGRTGVRHHGTDTLVAQVTRCHLDPAESNGINLALRCT